MWGSVCHHVKREASRFIHLSSDDAGAKKLRAELMERGISAEPTESDRAWVRARVPARDPLLDAMAFSKGRFAVEVAGLPTLYVPSYPEVTRVVEDCR